MISAIIVDDEYPALDKMEKLLISSGMAEVVGKFSEALEALKFLKDNKVDAVFLDIEMPNMNGIELASRILDLQKNCSIVFVTAYNQYAVEAFGLNALDYLLKPVSAIRLGETLNRIARHPVVSMKSEKLNICCFGGFSVKAGNDDIRFRTEKAEELLAFLIDQGGCIISRDKIIDCLWEDFDGDRAVVHFNTTLYNVKKALLNFGVENFIQYERGCYRLNTGSFCCDYFKFCMFGKNTEAALKETICEYEDTASYYSGEYLAGRDYSWALGRRLSLEEQWVGLLLKISEYYKRTGSYPEALKWLKKGLLQEPLHRELNYQLLEVLLMTYEHALAAKHYDLYKKGLLEKYGQLPDNAFKMLMKR